MLDSPDESAIQEIEVTLLLEGIFQRYGYDFRDYARSSILRRVKQFLETCGCSNLSEATAKVLRDRSLFYQLTQHFSIPVTEMFRDAFVFSSLRKHVIPLLRTWPFFKIWHAGCATGEEVYSLAILLQEEGIYPRSTIYATDINEAALNSARKGIYPLDKIRKATKHYNQSGGTRSLADYYRAQYGAAILEKSLRDRITFAAHNLATDSVFGEMQLVICRNVLIYFNKDLQHRALSLFTQSLEHGGFLCLGSKETLMFTEFTDHYEVVDEKARIYKRTALAH